MVNSIATARGKVKERARLFTATEVGFEQRPTNEEIIQENLRRFNLIYPNSFHCEVGFKSYCPFLKYLLIYLFVQSYCPRKGDYENPEIAHCIATVLFHGPGSVGAMYPDYFADMPLTVVAFVLAIVSDFLFHLRYIGALLTWACNSGSSVLRSGRAGGSKMVISVWLRCARNTRPS